MVIAMHHLPRALVLGLNYSPETTGISPYTTAMARGLVNRGHAVRVVTAHPHYPQWKISPGYGEWSRREQVDGVIVDRKRHFVPNRPKPVPRAVSETSFGLRAATTRWGSPDAIVAVSPALISSTIARLRAALTHRSVPFVVWVQDLYGLGVAETGQGSQTAARAIGRMEAWLLRSADAVVVIHQRFADRIHRDFGVPIERIVVIRNWTHLPPMPAVDVDATRRKFGWPRDEIVVVHSGNMGVKQGLQHVVHAGRLATQRGQGVRFVLIGDGSHRNELGRLAAEQPAAVQFLPPLDDVDFPAALQAADVLLVNELPGVSEMAVPSKLTSYFAAGRPVVAATDVTGITADEVRAAGAGIVVPAGDPEALLAGIVHLTASASTCEGYGENGRRYRETVLDETFAIDRFDSLLADLTAGAGTTATTADAR